MLELYHNGSSVCAAKVRILLAEKDISWHSHYLDILAGDQFDPAYLKLNPSRANDRSQRNRADRIHRDLRIP